MENTCKGANIISLISGVKTIMTSISDKNIRNRSIQSFAPTFDELMKTKKYLYIECEGYKWVHIYNSIKQLEEISSIQDIFKEKEEHHIETICKEISYDEFLKMADGEHMNFEKYSTLNQDLMFDF